jgi:hypothetical protein
MLIFVLTGINKQDLIIYYNENCNSLLSNPESLYNLALQRY